MKLKHCLLLLVLLLIFGYVFRPQQERNRARWTASSKAQHSRGQLQAGEKWTRATQKAKRNAATPGAKWTARVATPEEGQLLAGFGETDITPKLDGKPVYMAGFGQNRKATKVHDPIMARAVVLKHGKHALAMVSVDLVGFFYPDVLSVRKQLPEMTYVLVSSTHNHEGPDTVGLWGPNPFTSGIDPDYMKFVEEGIVKAVRAADAAARVATARIGTARAPELLHDGREPYVLHDELVAVQFDDAKTKKPAFLLVQWNCHPETLDSKNTELSADYVHYTVAHLRERHGCPVAYFTGTVGGLMTSLHVSIKDENGTELKDGTFEKTERYGRLLGDVASRALKDAKPVALTPFTLRSRSVHVPMDNKVYHLGRALGVLKREVYVWTGDIYQGKVADAKTPKDTRLSIRTEVAWLRLGDLDVACIPGEIYPELILDKVQDPIDPAADFPDAAIEPAIYKQLKGPHRMLIGLANDEIGYILPKRQWDEKAPFCYGRKRSQYGEQNSVGPEAGPIVCRAFKELVEGKK